VEEAIREGWGLMEKDKEDDDEEETARGDFSCDWPRGRWKK